MTCYIETQVTEGTSILKAFVGKTGNKKSRELIQRKFAHLIYFAFVSWSHGTPLLYTIYGMQDQRNVLFSS